MFAVVTVKGESLVSNPLGWEGDLFDVVQSAPAFERF